MDEGGEQAVDADRGADRGDALAEEAHHQVVVAAAAEDRAELRRVEEHRLEHRAGVVGEAAGDRHVERHLVVAVSQGVEVVGDLLDEAELGVRVLHPREGRAQLGERRPPVRGRDSEEALDLVDLPAGQADTADRVAGGIDVPLGQLQADLLHPHLVELVEDAEDIARPLGGDAGVGEEDVQDAARGEADAERPDLERVQGVAHAGHDLGVGDLRFSADRVEVELSELAEAPLVRLVGAPDRGDLVAAEGARQLAVLGDHPGERHGQVEAQAERLRLGVADREDRLRRLLPGRGAAQDVEVLDGGRRQGDEAVELVDTADGVDHVLAGQQLLGQEIAQAARDARFHSVRLACHGEPSRGDGTDVRI